jgi:hypothetical protein
MRHVGRVTHLLKKKESRHGGHGEYGDFSSFVALCLCARMIFLRALRVLRGKNFK